MRMYEEIATNLFIIFVFVGLAYTSGLVVRQSTKTITKWLGR